MMKKFLAVLMLMMILPLMSLSAKDFGVLLDQSASLSGIGDANAFEYGGTAAPWFSSPLSWNNAEITASAGLTIDYANEDLSFVPELLRTEFSFDAGENGRVAVGRMLYADPLGFIVNGLLDGASYTHNLENGFAAGSTLSAGLWYTGLLYKKNAHITMTAADLTDYETEFDFADFADTYFAPSRVVFAVDWKHPGLLELIRLQTALIGQFDLADDKDARFHSQYLAGKAALPYNQFIFEAGAALEMAQAMEDTFFSFAGELGVKWMLPTSFTDQLHFMGRFSNGTSENGGSLVAFVPITTEPQGYVLNEKFSGLSMLQLEYVARLHQTLSVSIADSYFLLSDLGTYQGMPSGKDGHLLGNEVYVSATWVPLSDVQVKAGGGVFLPSLGNADKEADPMWRLDISLVLAVF
jgi:hypothetical protein